MSQGFCWALNCGRVLAFFTSLPLENAGEWWGFFGKEGAILILWFPHRSVLEWYLPWVCWSVKPVWLCLEQGYRKEMKEFGSTRLHLASAAPKVHNDSTKCCEPMSSISLLEGAPSCEFSRVWVLLDLVSSLFTTACSWKPELLLSGEQSREDASLFCVFVWKWSAKSNSGSDRFLHEQGRLAATCSLLLSCHVGCGSLALWKAWPLSGLQLSLRSIAQGMITLFSQETWRVFCFPF